VTQAHIRQCLLSYLQSSKPVDEKRMSSHHRSQHLLPSFLMPALFCSSCSGYLDVPPCEHSRRRWRHGVHEISRLTITASPKKDIYFIVSGFVHVCGDQSLGHPNCEEAAQDPVPASDPNPLCHPVSSLTKGWLQVQLTEGDDILEATEQRIVGEIRGHGHSPVLPNLNGEDIFILIYVYSSRP
jgi:hypothetical protein